MCDATSGDRWKLETQSREREWGGVTMIRGEHIYHFVWVGEKVHFGNIRRRLHDRVQFSARTSQIFAICLFRSVFLTANLEAALDLKIKAE